MANYVNMEMDVNNDVITVDENAQIEPERDSDDEDAAAQQDLGHYYMRYHTIQVT